MTQKLANMRQVTRLDPWSPSQLHAVSLAPTWPLPTPLTPAMLVQASQVPLSIYEICFLQAPFASLAEGRDAKDQVLLSPVHPHNQHQPDSKSGLRNVHKENKPSQMVGSSGTARGTALRGWKGGWEQTVGWEEPGHKRS